MISGQSAGFLFFLFCFLVSERMFYSSDMIESETSSPVITVSRTACVFLFFPPCCRGMEGNVLSSEEREPFSSGPRLLRRSPGGEITHGLPAAGHKHARDYTHKCVHLYTPSCKCMYEGGLILLMYGKPQGAPL